VYDREKHPDGEKLAKKYTPSVHQMRSGCFYGNECTGQWETNHLLRQYAPT